MISGLATWLRWDLWEEDRTLDHSPAGSRKGVPCGQATVNTKPGAQAEKYPVHLHSSLAWAAHGEVCLLLSCFVAPPPSLWANRRAIQLHLCRQALCPNLTSPRRKTVGIFEITNPDLRRPTAFKKLADFSC